MKINQRQKGFTLIELLIVVAIILIIAAIAIPNLLQSKMAANQASAVGSLRTINTADVTYSSSYNIAYANTLAMLGGPTGVAATCNLSELIDPVLSTATAGVPKSGYTFTYTGATAFTGVTPAGCTAGWLNFSVNATPLNNSTGHNVYCIDDSGVIRVDITAAYNGNACGTSGLPAMQ
ncbi:MAG: prepilin-type N-terminal cleavage/methylation domain-containing protein [Acidobacteriota bacterium]|nr:prepilin-type N-terminal cleavage/methylation domain-containing protein [Acidobacteriota bacterium]